MFYKRLLTTRHVSIYLDSHSDRIPTIFTLSRKKQGEVIGSIQQGINTLRTINKYHLPSGMAVSLGSWGTRELDKMDKELYVININSLVPQLPNDTAIPLGMFK